MNQPALKNSWSDIPPDGVLSPRRPGESQVLWAIWLTYGSFYFCRQNISAAVPGLEASGITKTEIGSILAALKITYAIGQLVNGQLAERIGARRLLAIGMLTSAALNVVFGFAEGLYFLTFIWACNGYFQSLGWTPCVRVAANWVPVDRRGPAMGFIGTSYQLMAGVTYLVAGYSAQWFGWRAAMYVPAALLAASAVHMLVMLRETPDEIPVEGSNATTSTTQPSRQSFVVGLRETISNPALWVLGIALAFLDACRYGFQDWGLAHLKEAQGAHVGITAAKYAVLPAGGIVGALFGGWVTDRFFSGRRAPAICGFLLLLTMLTLGYDEVAKRGGSLITVLLFAIGFAIFGAQVLLVGSAPADLARNGTAAAAAGFVNSMGYLGAFAGDKFTGYLADTYDWKTAIRFWAACALAAAAVVTMLWNTGPRGNSACRPSSSAPDAANG